MQSGLDGRPVGDGLHESIADDTCRSGREKCESMVLRSISLSQYFWGFPEQIRQVITVLDHSGRIDHILSQINTLHKADRFLRGIDVFLMTRNSLSWILRPGSHLIRVPERFVQQEYWCSYAPIGSPTKVTTKGLKYDLTGK